MAFTQAAITDDPSEAYRQMRDYLTGYAGRHGWTQGELDTALEDVDTAEDSTTLWDATWNDPLNPYEWRVQEFWRIMADSARSWTAPGASEMAVLFADYADTAERIPTYEPNISEVVTDTAEDVARNVENVTQGVAAAGQAAGTVATSVGTSRFFLPVVGLVAVAFIVRSFR